MAAAVVDGLPAGWAVALLEEWYGVAGPVRATHEYADDIYTKAIDTGFKGMVASAFEEAARQVERLSD